MSKQVQVRSFAGDGEWLVIGNSVDDTIAENAGAVVFFERVEGSWIERDKVTASDAEANDRFGAAVALSGAWAIIGANLVNDAADVAGAAYVFRRMGASWVEHQKLITSDAAFGDWFGRRVALDDDAAVISAPLDDNAAGIDAGAAYVFRRVGDDWLEEQKLTPLGQEAEDIFGGAVAIDGDVIVVGAPGMLLDLTPGNAYVFRHNGSSWIQEQELISADLFKGDQLGRSVAVSGDVVVVGNGLNDTAVVNGGAAHVFRFDGNNWVDEQTLTASDAAFGDFFGGRVAISAGLIVCGASSSDDSAGAAYVFSESNGTWQQARKLEASPADAGDGFGAGLLLHGEALFIGASGDDDGCAEEPDCDSGAIYTYSLDDTDTDGDDVADACDNCVLFNPDQADCDANGIGDACVGPNDFTGDGAVGLSDHNAFADCTAGPDVPPDHSMAVCEQPCLTAFDTTADEDVDLEDYAAFQIAFTGP